MSNPAFDLSDELKLREITYRLHERLWNQHTIGNIDLQIGNWTTFKYLNDSGDSFHQDIDLLPKTSGGIYLFHIKCPVIPGMTDFPVYLGRAQLTKGQNLRKRCKEYYQKFSRSKERPKITRLFKYWKNDLYLSFIPLQENKDIIDYEKKLINSLKLPFNDDIPDLQIRNAIQAFN